MTRPTRIVGTVSYLPLRPLAPIYFAMDCGALAPFSAYCTARVRAVRVGAACTPQAGFPARHPRLSGLHHPEQDEGTLFSSPVPSCRFYTWCYLLWSAAACCRFSSCPATTNASFPGRLLPKESLFSCPGASHAALPPPLSPFTPRVTTLSPAVLTYILPHSVLRSHPRAQHPSSVWRSQRPHRRHSR
jgi:hypothetical protein